MGEERFTRVDRMPPSGPDDVTVLVARARLGDLDACRRLFRTHMGFVHRVVYRLTGPGPDVEDFVQASFVEAFRALPSFRGEALFTTWLTRIAVRVTMRSAKRRTGRHVPLEAANEPAADAPGPDRVVEARQALKLLDQLLDEMRPKRRAAFVLHVLEGYSMEEAAAILNTSVAAVKVRVHDARKQIESRCKTRPDLAAWMTQRGGNS
jgi:RNA polymerase sigma-70 factor (ECF subfamily)